MGVERVHEAENSLGHDIFPTQNLPTASHVIQSLIGGLDDIIAVAVVEYFVIDVFAIEAFCLTSLVNVIPKKCVKLVMRSSYRNK
jgi:hypothetical protein